jgi:hypothetical protein
MSFELVLLPVLQEYEKAAYEVEQKIKRATKTLTTSVDTNYSTSISGKVLKYRKTDKDIIVVDRDYLERNNLSIRFSDKGSRPQVMSLTDLIDLLVSLEDEDESDEPEGKDADTSEKRETSETKEPEESKDGGCVVM